MTRVSIWTYRVALRACPPDFRREFGARMVEDFRALLTECGGSAARVGLVLRESSDVVRAAWRDRRTSRGTSPLGPGKPPARERARLLWDDVTFAARSLRSRPGYALVSVLTLTLGIGATTMVFSVIDRVVIQPLPYPDADRFVYLFAHDRQREQLSNFPTTPGDYRDWRALSTSFDVMEAVRERNVVLTGGSHLERVRLGEVTDGTFASLGARPQLGTILTAASAPDDLLLSHGTWQQVFGGDPDVIGRQVAITGENHTVVGVTEPGFRHPWGSMGMWKPLRLVGEPAADRSDRSTIVLARMKPGVTRSQALAEMTSITDALSAEYSETNEQWGIHILTLKGLYLENSGTMYLVLAAAVGLVLLITSVNLASLVLARGGARRVEMAVRMALGAGRLRVLRLLFAEGALVAVASAAIGLMIAAWGLTIILPLAPRWPLVLHETAITGRSFAFAVAVAAAALPVSCVLPAARLTRAGLDGALRGNRGASASAKDLRFRKALIVSQITLALVLMIGAGLLIRSTYNIISADTGFDFDGVMSARVMMQGDVAGAGIYFGQLLERARTLPETSEAALVDAAPMDGNGDWVRIFVNGARVQEERALGADFRRVSPGYFDLLGINLVVGRLLTARDDGEPVVLINEMFATKFLKGREPLGMTIATAPSMGRGTDSRRQWTIVGVVETVQEWGPSSFDIPIIYLPFGSSPAATMSLLLRTEADAGAMVDPIRAIVREVGDSPIAGINPLGAYFRRTYTTQRFMLAMLGAFAALAATLSAIGLYGVMAYHVIQRRREIGVRLALGAARNGVAMLVLRQGVGMATLAGVIGVGAAVPLARAMSTMNFGRLLVDMHWFDPVVFAAVPLLVLLTAVLASWIPARRAARVDPVEALRAES